MDTQRTIDNDYIKQEFDSLNTRQISTHVENVRVVCFFDNHFNKPHIVPSYKQLDRLHSHSYFELFAVKKGPFSIRFKGVTHTFSDGNSILLAPSVLHRSVIDSPLVIRYNFCFLFEKVAIKTDVDLYSSLSVALKKDVTLFKDKRIFQILEDIGTSFANNEHAEISLNVHKLLNIFTKERKENPITVSEHTESRSFKLFHIINNHYMDNLTLDDLSKTIFLSTKQISRIIKKQHGCSFSTLITKLRMNAAAEFLITTNMKISEIATRIGFSSLSGFYTAFNKEYGTLPSKYRKINKR